MDPIILVNVTQHCLKLFWYLKGSLNKNRNLIGLMEISREEVRVTILAKEYYIFSGDK